MSDCDLFVAFLGSKSVIKVIIKGLNRDGALHGETFATFVVTYACFHAPPHTFTRTVRATAASGVPRGYKGIYIPQNCQNWT